MFAMCFMRDHSTSCGDILKFCIFLLLLSGFSLSQSLEVVDVTAQGLPHGVHIVVGDAKLLTGLSDYGGDERVVGLDHTREEMVSGLVVEGSSEDIPEPAVSGIVLSGGHLHLSPVRERESL